MQRLIILSMLLATTISYAQLEHPTIRDAREHLVPYGPDSLRVISALGELARDGDRRVDQIDARYLRAIASTDLLLLDHLGEGDASAAQIAEALGVAPRTLTSYLHDELTELAYGQYFTECVDAMRAIEVIDGGTPGEWTGHSSRRDVLGVLRILGQPTETLAQFGEDPCARAGSPCPDPWALFDADGRKAMQALQAAHGTLAHLEQQVREGGDPLAAAIAQRLPQLHERLEATVLSPTPDWRRALRTPTVVLAAQGEPGHAQMVLHVDAHSVRLIPVPQIRITNGEAVLVAEPTEIPMPSSRRAFITAIPEVVAWLSEADVQNPVALSADPQIEALLFWQIIASAERANVPLRQLAVVDGRGRLFTRRFRVQDSAPANEAQVFVRLGGYSVRTGSRSVRLPRTYTGSEWVHDRQGLRSAVGRTETVAFRTMGIAPASLLLDAVFTPDARAATLVR